MVELALMLPLLTLILVGTVDLGRAFFYYTRLTDAVQQGVLTGIHTPAVVTDSSSDPDIATYPSLPTPYSSNNDSIKYQVKQESGYLNLTNANITVTCYSATGTNTWSSTSTYCNQATSGDLIVVKATYKFYPFTGQVIRIFGTYLTMSKTVRAVIL
jgi:Flp pilus assembly protein TadG